MSVISLMHIIKTGILQMVQTHILGFSRIGPKRELKFALERYWKQQITQANLHETAQVLRRRHWDYQSQLDWVTLGDFSYYDQVLDMSLRLNVIPQRFQQHQGASALDRYFDFVRGFQAQSQQGQPLAACEMTKWFDTNYHYIVPELHQQVEIKANPQDLLEQIQEAKTLNKPLKVVLLGPITYLKLAKTTDDSQPLGYLEPLLNAYDELLQALSKAGIEWVQLDEPALSLSLDEQWRHAYRFAYHQLQGAPIKILIATYFGALKDQLQLLCELPAAGVHIDAIAAADEISPIVDWLPAPKVLSLGIINGRNIWRADLEQIYSKLIEIKPRLGERLWLSSSCSLLHVPVDIEQEASLDNELKQWLAFGIQKINELAILKQALVGDTKALAAIQYNTHIIDGRATSKRIHKDSVQAVLDQVQPSDYQRQSSFAERFKQQQQQLNLPLLPTTTIGSFPQTPAIRNARKQFKQGQLSQADYNTHMRAFIKECIDKQLDVDLDVLVHGEPERNDMVEYFGEHLEGFALTSYGWVQSYGSRCVKPPILYADVEHKGPITTEWIEYAQSLTDRPVKGMLTGPITLLNWSFVRDDQPRSLSAKQLALAIRQEVLALEQAGVDIIQIDEAALREGLPLRREHWDEYLDWAINSFKLASSAVKDSTQIHTHMCYSQFNDILPAIAAMDADVITIETARSDGRLLQAFEQFKYPQCIGPGVYDIHSPNVPTIAEIHQRLEQAKQRVDIERLWVNPDCGLKTRQWQEVLPALTHMVKAAKQLRQTLQQVPA